MSVGNQLNYFLDQLGKGYFRGGVRFGSTVAATTIKRELGSLSPSLQARVADAVHRLFALDRADAGGLKAEPEDPPEEK